jgi:hypothetical protein
MDRTDLQSALPNPRDGEPPTLRSDIADELADHLSCAVTRELRRNNDESEAHRAALEKFGNPPSLARKLYLDAMKEHIMKDRILLTAVVLLTIISLASVALSWGAMAQGRRLNESLIAKLDSLQAASPADLDWTSATISVVKGSDEGPPAGNWKVALTGHAINPGEQTYLLESTDAKGAAHFGPIRPGKYSLQIFSEWGDRWHEDNIMMWPGKPYVRKVVGPAQELPKHPVQISTDWPPDLAEQEIYLVLGGYHVDPNWGPGRWLPGTTSSLLLKSDGQVLVGRETSSGSFGGEGFSGRRFERGSIRPFDPAFPAGKHHFQVVAVSQRRLDNDRPTEETFADLIGLTEHSSSFVVKEGKDNRWKLDLPDELVEQIRTMLRGQSTGAAAKP